MGKLLGWDYRIIREDKSHEQLRPIFFVGFSKYRITVGFEPIVVINVQFWSKEASEKIREIKAGEKWKGGFTDEEIQAEIDRMDKEYEGGKKNG